MSIIKVSLHFKIKLSGWQRNEFHYINILSLLFLLDL